MAAYQRQSDLLDIDFTGGTSVQIVFKKDQPLDIAQVRKTVEPLEDALVSGVSISDETQRNLQYKIDTRESDIHLVEKRLMELFPGRLRTTDMNFSPIARVEANTPLPGTEPIKADQKGPGSISPVAPGTPTSGATPSAPGTTPASAPSTSPPLPKSPAGVSTPKPAEPAPATPPKNKQGRLMREPAHETLLALADEPQWLLAQATKTDTTNSEAAKSGTPKTEAAKTSPGQPSPQGKADKATPAAGKEADKGTPTKTTTSPTPPTTAPPPDTAPVKTSPSGGSLLGPAAEPLVNPFAGGSQTTLTFPDQINFESLKGSLDNILADKDIRDFNYQLYNQDHSPGSSTPRKSWILTISLSPEKLKPVLEDLKTKLGSSPIFLSANKIGGKVAAATQLSAIYAILASMLMISIYIWIRFQNLVFGLATVVALLHDVLVTVGVLAMSKYIAPYTGFLLIDPFKISLDVVAALLTIVGYSINDTIVVFDRIREVRGKSPDLNEDMINKSVNQTLSRTVLTVTTVLLVTVILYVGGGQGLHAFSFTMLVGLISGTYSSVYIAAPILLWLKRPTAAQSAQGRSRSAQPSGAM